MDFAWIDRSGMASRLLQNPQLGLFIRANSRSEPPFQRELARICRISANKIASFATVAFPFR